MLKTYPQYPNFYEVKHPLIQHKLSFLRDVNSTSKTFRELVKEITLLLVYEATENLALKMQAIETPLEKINTPILECENPIIVPILRAGIGMVDGFLSLIPSAHVGHIGLFRNEETLLPESYYFKIPKQCEDRAFFICDPMLATGGSVISAITQLKNKGIKNITFVCIIAAPEGLQKVLEAHPDITIFAANLDRELNSHGYILPGLGDAGDRLFGTK